VQQVGTLSASGLYSYMYYCITTIMAIYKTKGPTEYLFSPWVEITQCKHIYILLCSLHIIRSLKLCVLRHIFRHSTEFIVALFRRDIRNIHYLDGFNSIIGISISKAIYWSVKE